MSLDGYIDDLSGERLMLSSAEAFKRGDELRAASDAILVGAGTVRVDNPRLLVKSDPARRLSKVTVTSSGRLDPKSDFFTAGKSPKLVYSPDGKVKKLQDTLGDLAEVVGGGAKKVDLRFMLSDLERRGVRKLLVEGGAAVGSSFLQEGLSDELQLFVAPFFVGQSRAPRFVEVGKFLNDKNNRMKLVKVEQLGDTALLTYRLK